MHNSLLTEDTYKRADLIYKSIVEEFNPSLREYVNCGKVHEKNLAELEKSHKASYDAAVKMGITGANSPGCRDVGKCIMGISQMMQEMNVLREHWLRKYRDDIIYPTERRLEQETKQVVGIRKKAQEEFKSRSSECEKAYQNLSKLKKKTLGKTPSQKKEEKIAKAAKRLTSAKTAAEKMANDMLDKAFREERAKYCFFVGKQCEVIKASLKYHRQATEILEASLQEWEEMGASERDLLPGAVALIESSKGRKSSGVCLDDFDVQPTVREKKVRTDDFIKMYQGPEVEQPQRDTSQAYLRRSMTTIDRKKTSSPIRPVKPPPVIRNEDDEDSDSESEDGDSYHEADVGLLTVDADAVSTISRNSSTSSSIHLTALFRQPAVSSLSLHSQGSSHSGDAGSNRLSIHDSGISMEENWASESDEYDTIKRSAKNQDKQGNHSPPSPRILITSEAEEENEKEESSVEPMNLPAPVEIYYKAFHPFNPPEGSASKLAMEKGDAILVLVNENKGGWMYGENSRTKERGWFPVTYTTPQKREVEEEGDKQVQTEPNNDSQEKTSPDKDSPVLTMNTHHTSLKKAKKMPTGQNVFQFAEDMKNPFEEIKLRKTTAASLN